MEIVSAKSSCCCLVYGDMCPAVWSKLPEDLFIELFQRLPEEALLRFRCVSKDYDFLITRIFLPKLAASARVSGFVFQWLKVLYTRDHRFNKRRPEKPGPTPKYYYGYVSQSGATFALKGGELIKSYLNLLPFEPNADDFLGCFNGFFLVRNSSFAPIQYYICNPATRQCLTIQLNHKHMQKDSFAGLAFDPLDSPSHNFKIVRVDCSPPVTSSSLDNQPWELDVFSSATGKWVNHRIPLKSDILEVQWNTRSIYFDGVFYMLSMRKYLLCFDLESIEYNALKARAIELPPRSRDDCTGIFEKSNGCLYYACKVDADLLVWTFQVGNEASPWTLKYNFSTWYLAALPSGDRLSRQKFIFAVDLSAEIIYAGSVYLVYTYDIKNNKIENFGSIDYGYITYAASLCFYPFSCCLIRLSDQFSLNRQLMG